MGDKPNVVVLAGVRSRPSVLRAALEAIVVRARRLGSADACSSCSRDDKGNATTADGSLAIRNDCAPGREAEFEQWYQSEHLAERLAVPGFPFGRRHEASFGSPRYFTFYVTETTDVLASGAYLSRLNEPTPLTQRVMSGAI
jgi:hypothetical protein